ncbi:MarC family protein [Bradyrhizobium sp. CCBAU 45389]|uniref:MarC family protein n=1 Tax=Bradyrhizobium sp. CCBAU 45389 TaxID=858429 RepID=UPI002306CD0C|nr:MarC family protein [Bradyrhizobium sp. CCBAU 45389]MDA9400601.1 antibiotic resistance protein [Bradyrhizobium sp. CCBAU 45389]
MLELTASRWVADFLFGFGALFAIINPYGLAFIFLDRTISLSEAERARVALRVAAYAFAVLLVSLFLGSQILNIFGVTIPALRIAGGLVVAAAGWSMLHATPTSASAHAAASADVATIQRMAFFPLTIPLTTGPGTIATAIAIGISRSDSLDGMFASSIVSLVVALAVTVTIYHAYRKSSAMARLFGQEGTSVVTKLSAFLLLCIGVQIIITGTSEVARSILEGASHAVR